jgi:hypothetical protein
MGDEKPGNVLTQILGKAAALKDAMEGTDVGVRPPTKKAVEVKKVVEAEPTPDGKPTKYTVPRDKTEGLEAYGNRLDGLVKAWKAKQ